MPGALLERVTYILDVLFHFLNTNLVLSKHETANSKPMRNTFEDILLKLKLSIVTRKCRKSRGLFKTNRYYVYLFFCLTNGLYNVQFPSCHLQDCCNRTEI